MLSRAIAKQAEDRLLQVRSAYKEEGCDHVTYSAGPEAFELEEGLAFLYCKENNPNPKETCLLFHLLILLAQAH